MKTADSGRLASSGAIAPARSPISTAPSSPIPSIPRPITTAGSHATPSATWWVLSPTSIALEIAPRYVEAYNNRGIVRHTLGDYAGALADFDQALEIDPHHAEALNNRGAARQALGEFGAAVADFDRALNLRPRYAEAYNNRGSRGMPWGTWQEPSPTTTRPCKVGPASPQPLSTRIGLRRDTPSGITKAPSPTYDEALRLTPDLMRPRSTTAGAGPATPRATSSAPSPITTRPSSLDPALCAAYISRGHARYHRRDSLFNQRLSNGLPARCAAGRIGDHPRPDPGPAS